MRTTARTALVATAVLLSACGSGGVDLDAALLTADDLPDDVELLPVDALELTGTIQSMAQLLENVTYEPAECQDDPADPLRRHDVESAGMAAVSGDDVFVQAVYTGASVDDITAIEEYYQRCREVTVSGEMAGKPVDLTIRTHVTGGPPVDADHVIALDATTTAAGAPDTLDHVVYLIDGAEGMFVAVTPESSTFDLDELTVRALEKLRAARG
ncbi:hypothetical protein [Jiangella sp. DSM 45060]|uniref:hypothetical protein n=1 Tax=Jiangella sp. DSM 45060 TaxID=1798224 RepID=UPI000879D0D0|nr:hypothetical protein [Jiangella sp. DSM 45060]SDT65817.1 hypothetical protein SAMN04515669_5537 [Jiangella sp. DSM 45060]